MMKIKTAIFDDNIAKIPKISKNKGYEPHSKSEITRMLKIDLKTFMLSFRITFDT